MNATTTTNIAEPTAVVVKIKRKYVRKDKPVLVVESDSEEEEEEEEVEEATEVVTETEDEPEDEDAEEEEDAEEDDKSTISSIQEEVEEEVETEAEAYPEAEIVAEEEMPVLESDPVLLREQILTLKAEVIRLTKFNHELQVKAEGIKKQPKKKADKEAKAKKEGKRTNTRAKRPTDYAEKYLEKGQVLRWEHKARKAWGEATYIGDNKFIGKFSFVPESEFPEEFPSLNAVAGVMLKHLTLRSLNAWSAFKNLDGTSVENLDL